MTQYNKHNKHFIFRPPVSLTLLIVSMLAGLGGIVNLDGRENCIAQTFPSHLQEVEKRAVKCSINLNKNQAVYLKV